MTAITFTSVTKRFGRTCALDGFSLELHPGELVCLLGPSGCGKTTALRLLAGFDQPDTGNILVAGRSVLGVPAQRRHFGMVFQAYSLFPNMSAAANVSFALQVRKVDRARRRARTAELLELVGLAEHAEKYPHQLSGGQQQRVALARALAVEPPVLLLDEPLSALDAAVRDQLRDEIRRLQQRLGITTLFVTHDQQEAMAIADRIAVMRAGRLIQQGEPAEVYLSPADSFVSTFLGTTNRLAVRRGPDGAALVLGRPVPLADPGADSVHVRPEHLHLELIPATPDLAADRLQGLTPDASARVVGLSFQGALTRVTVACGAETLVVDVPSVQAAALRLGDAAEVSVRGPVLAASR